MEEEIVSGCALHIEKIRRVPLGIGISLPNTTQTADKTVQSHPL
ncbi:hypothetical protein [Treponema sp.]